MGEVQRIAVIWEADQSAFDRLTLQITALGMHRIMHYSHPNIEELKDTVRRETTDAGVLVASIKDAVLGPAHIAELRLALPDWIIIVLDHVGDLHSAADAFAAGANDVLRVPHPPREFEARVALRMRDAGMATAGSTLDAPLFARAQLTPIESEILRILIANKGGIVTRNQLSLQLDQSDWLYGDRKFDVHIMKIRKKLQAAFGELYLVRTIRAKGYLIQFAQDSDQPN